MAITLADSASVNMFLGSSSADWLLHKYSQIKEAGPSYQAGGDHPSEYFVN